MDNVCFTRIVSRNVLLPELSNPKLSSKCLRNVPNGSFQHFCGEQVEVTWSTFKNSGNWVLFISKERAKYNYAGRCRSGHLQIFNTQKDPTKADIYASKRDGQSSSLQNREGGSERNKSSSTDESVYLFQTEGGGQVKVIVSRIDTSYKVALRVTSLPQRFGDLEHGLRLHWGLFRTDSSQWVILDSGSWPAGTTFVTGSEQDFMQTPFQQGPVGSHSLDLTFASSLAPFFLTFVLHTLDAHENDFWIRTHLGKNFCVPVGIGRGYSAPLGFSLRNDGSANFALFSRNAENVILCLYKATSTEPSLEIDLDPYLNRTGDIWHISLETLGEHTRYGYRCKGDISWDKGNRFHARRVLLDPYSKILAPFVSSRDNLVSPATCLGWLMEEPSFEWGDDNHPSLPLESLVVYRLNVGGFTAHESSGLQAEMRGTFLGLIDKLYHLKGLGVNAVLLEPIFTFDREQGPFYPYNFFAPMGSYGPSGDSISAINSLKEMIKTLHKNGIEVLLEVVYTHTAEKGDASPKTISFRGIDNSSYYILDENNEVAASETANLFNCNHPIAQKMILDSLRYWVNEYHVDGFCFCNASSLVRGPHGENLSRPPLIEAIAFDPILSKTKIIADPCLASMALCKEIPFPHWKKWAELNVSFRDDVRRFLKGDKGQLSNFATRLCGSGDLFTDGRGPNYSFNFISSNFGLSLVDLVSYSDGVTSTELSWNCGDEGPTNNRLVLETRLKQIRNFLFILFISLGVPVLNMGDEYGQTRGGSVLLNDRKPFDWDALKTEFGVQTTQFIGFLSSLRLRRSDLLQRRNFLKIENLNWHGPYPYQPQWEDPSSSFLAVSLKPEKNDTKSRSSIGDLYIAFNSQQDSENATLPQLDDGEIWYRLVDTSLPFPETFLTDGTTIDVTGTTIDVTGTRFSTYDVKPHSCVLFEARMSALAYHERDEDNE